MPMSDTIRWYTATEVRNDIRAILDKVRAGEQAVVLRNGVPTAFLLPYTNALLNTLQALHLDDEVLVGNVDAVRELLSGGSG